MKDKIKFKEFMTGIGLLFEKNISDPLKDVYWNILEPFSDEQCEKAFNQIIATCRFFPKPTEFLEIIQGTRDDKAIMAWVKTIKAVREIGNGESVQFDDTVIHSVIEAMGGWIDTGEWLQKDEKWIMREFISIYRVAEGQNWHPKYLIGEFEENNQFPYDLRRFIRGPVLIGTLESGGIGIQKDQRPFSEVIAHNEKKLLGAGGKIGKEMP